MSQVTPSFQFMADPVRAQDLTKELYRYLNDSSYKILLSAVPMSYGFADKVHSTEEIAEYLDVMPQEVSAAFKKLHTLLESESIRKFMDGEMSAQEAVKNVASAIVALNADIHQDFNLDDWRDVQRVLKTPSLAATVDQLGSYGVRVPAISKAETPKAQLQEAFALVGYCVRFNQAQKEEVVRYMELGNNFISFNTGAKRLAKVALYEFATLEARKLQMNFSSEYALSRATIGGFRNISENGWEEFFPAYDRKRKAELTALVREATKLFEEV